MCGGAVTRVESATFNVQVCSFPRSQIEGMYHLILEGESLFTDCSYFICSRIQDYAVIKRTSETSKVFETRARNYQAAQRESVV